MRKKRKRQTRRRAFWMLLYSSFVVALVPMVVSIAVSLALLLSRAEMVENNYQAAADSVGKAFTNARNAVYGQFGMVANNETIQEYSAQAARKYWTELRIHEMLASAVSADSNIRSAFLYLKQFDLVLSAGNNLSRDLYWRVSKVEETDAWQAMISEAGTVPQMYIQDDCVTMTRKIHQSYDDACGSVLVFVVDKKALCASVMTAAVEKGDRLAVYYGDTPYMTDLPNAAAPAVPLEEGQYEQDGHAYRVFRAGERTGPFQVFYLADLSGGMMQKADSSWIVVCVALCVLATTVLCIVMTMRNYSPLQNIMNMLDIKYGEMREDEYESIAHKALQFETQLSAMKQTLNKHADEFQTMYLEKLLLGKVQSKESIQSSVELFNLRFRQEDFLLLLVDTEASIDARYEDTDAGKLILTVTELVAAMLEGDETMYVLDCNALPVVMINTGRTALLRERLEEMFVSLRKLLGMPIAYAIGSAPADIVMLGALYKETLARLESGGAGKESDRGALDPNVETCLALIGRSYMNVDFGVSEMAEELGLNPSYLSRCFKQQTGIGPLEYVNRYRVNAARNLLDQDPNILLRDLALRTGFRSEATLIRAFKKYEGCTPGQYKAGRTE